MKAAYAKLVIAILLDLADFVIGRIIGFGSGFDVLLALIGYVMFGWKGLVQLWELADLSDQADGFVPTLTLVAIAELAEKRKQVKSG